MQEVHSGDVESTTTSERTVVELVPEEELVLTPTAASVLARLVRAHLAAPAAA
jgi:hypothetical protein